MATARRPRPLSRATVAEVRAGRAMLGAVSLLWALSQPAPRVRRASHRAFRMNRSLQLGRGV